MSENKKSKSDEEKKHKGEDYLTTNQGVRITDTDNSLKAGSRGPTIMDDFHFREKMTHFDHERIPERVVHARGAGAHGHFQVYEPMNELTKAGFLQDPEKKTPVFVRFSTVVGSRGSKDTPRDVRGFATKFYTEEGNYDLVANNIPVFFIQDGIKFPDLVHAIKPEPDKEMPQASAAHNNFWDFISLTPESLHMIMWVLSDRAIPRSFRMMEGFGVHTFRMINDEGKSRFVKFHWRPRLGTHSLVWDEAEKLGGKDPDWNRKDLWEAIEKGDYPEFELGVQVVEEENEFAFDFDLLDPTKIIPEELVPIKPIGKMTLNRNPKNFFAETEQVAFHPGHVVPGIDFTNDPLLQGRLFSYTDTQLIRLGGPNFAEIPINRPHASVNNNQQDGFMRQQNHNRKANYSPNTTGGGCPFTASGNEGGYEHHEEKVEGHKIRERTDSFQDHYSQASLFWNSMSKAEKRHIIQAAHFELGKVDMIPIRERMVEHFRRIDPDLAEQVAQGIGVKEVSEEAKQTVDEVGEMRTTSAEGKKSVSESPAVSMENTVHDTIESRKIAILVSEGVNRAEITQVKEALIEKGARVKVISKVLGTVEGIEGDELEVDKNYVTTGSIMYDAVYIPGGKNHIETLKSHGKALHFINEAYKHCKPIGATGEGLNLLSETKVGDLTIREEGNAGLHSSKGVVWTNETDSLDAFIDAFTTAIAQHRHWDREEEMVPG